MRQNGQEVRDVATWHSAVGTRSPGLHGRRVLQVGSGVNGGHCKPVQSTPHNAQNVIVYLWQISGSNTRTAEDSSLLGCDAVSLSEWLPTFRGKNAVHS